MPRLSLRRRVLYPAELRGHLTHNRNFTIFLFELQENLSYSFRTHLESVTVHSVLSNTLRDAQNLCYSHKFARYVSGFWHSHAKTPRGIVACEQELESYPKFKCFHQICYEVDIFSSTIDLYQSDIRNPLPLRGSTPNNCFAVSVKLSLLCFT